MRVLIGADTYRPDINGASYFTQRLARGMAERGHEVHVLLPSRSLRRTETADDGVTLHGLPSVPMPSHPTFRFPAPALLRRRVLREAGRIEPDVVHVQGHFFVGRTLLRAARRLGLPVVATNHFMPDNLVPYLRLPKRAEDAVADLGWKDCVRTLDAADVLTTPTPIAAELLKERGSRHDILPISCGVDPTRFDPDDDGTGFRREHGLGERPTYAYVGRLDEEKRVDELVRALPLVRKSVDAQLLIVGDGHERAALEKLAAGLGVSDRVAFAGFVSDEDLPRAYAACDVFCNASVAELQSIVTLEAMATGRPIVAANAGALPHLARDGVNGRTFEPGDVETLASHLTGLLTDGERRKEMGRRSLEIVAGHGLEASLASYEQAYELAASMHATGDAYRPVPDVLPEMAAGVRR